MSDDSPRFVHDCESCTFLGRYGEDEDTPYDLYHCLQGGTMPTVIARYGDDGPEYTSGMPFAAHGVIACLVEARRRAAEMGLDVRLWTSEEASR